MTGVRRQEAGVRDQESGEKFFSFPGSSLGAFGSCGSSRFFKMWLEPQIKDIPKLELGNKRNHHNRDSPRNLHLDVPTLVLVREKSMYLELVPARDSPNAQRPFPPLPEFFSIF